MAYSLVDVGFAIDNGGLPIESTYIETAVALTNITNWWTADGAYVDISGNRIVQWRPLKIGGVITLGQSIDTRRAILAANRINGATAAQFDRTGQTFYSASAPIDASGNLGFGLIYKPTLAATVQGLAAMLASSTSRFGVNMTTTAGGASRILWDCQHRWILHHGCMEYALFIER
jgi:hypothetical protein